MQEQVGFADANEDEIAGGWMFSLNESEEVDGEESGDCELRRK